MFYVLILIDFFFFFSSISQQEGSPFIVCMTYAFQTPEKLCFILDLMNGGDLHYHLSQHGVFSEREVRFYAAEVILGLEHMHNRYVVYRDLKVIYSWKKFMKGLFSLGSQWTREFNPSQGIHLTTILIDLDCQFLSMHSGFLHH